MPDAPSSLPDLPAIAPDANPPRYSLIVPIYNEEENLLELHRRVTALGEQLDGPLELILVDDGSRDRSLDLMRSLHGSDGRVSYVALARNFGHQIAVSAGMDLARGAAIIVLDADLQDPPELILEMAERWQEGYHVVYAQRVSRRKEGKLKRFLAYGFYRVLKQLADIDIPTDTGDFCLMDRAVLDVLIQMPERNRYLRGLRSWVGFNQTAVQFHRAPRHAGEVKYTFRKSLNLAIDGLVSFSKVPLRFSTYLGLFSAAIALIMAVLVFYWRVTQADSPVTGFAAIAIAVFFLGAVQLVSIGILGEYIGRIYEEVKGRPLYTIKERGLPNS
ncbi:MAG: glycosyltransferase family 2 protein [Cyanobacteria bacterium P01_H01_bin.130]